MYGQAGTPLIWALALIKKNLPPFNNLINVNTYSLSRIQNCKAEPIDIGRVVLFLASVDSKWISDQVFGTNGAMFQKTLKKI